MARFHVQAACAVLFLVPAVQSDLLEPPSMPTEVYVLYATNSLRKIDAVDSTFKIDFYTMLAWRDDRLYNISQFDINNMWHPYPEFINSDSEDVSVSMFYSVYTADALPNWVGISAQQRAAGGYWVAGSGRKTGTFVADLQLQAFPFDQQNATLVLESSVWTKEVLVWRSTPGMANSTKPIAPIGGWDDLGVRVLTTDKVYIGLEETYHRLTVSQTLRRQYGYYLSRVVSNMILLALMAFLVVFVPGDMPDRLGFVQASFLGVVSWLFVLSSETPKVGYLTILDSFTQLTFAAIFIQYVYFALHAAYHKHLKGTLGQKKEWAVPGSRHVLVPKAGSAEQPVENPMHHRGAMHLPEAEEVSNSKAFVLPWPCSRHGEFNKMKASRRLDMVFTASLMVAYAIAVAVIIGGSVAKTEAGLL